MGKIGGFMEFDRTEPGYRPKEERIADWKSVEEPLGPEEISRQAARCMNCGTPFCHGAGCPLANVIPDINEAVYREEWKEALTLLLSTNNFPEFTARICPALCEASCTLELSNGQPVTVRQIELMVIEEGFKRGYMKPRIPRKRTGRRVAVIGAGPSGLAVADSLNRIGHEVTVFDRAGHPGGILRYGIPEFKLEKRIVDRRVTLMADEGVKFECGVTVGEDVPYKFIEEHFDAACLTGGAGEPRDLPIPGRELEGICFAMGFLSAQNRRNDGERIPPAEDITAADKRVVVIGGGDTGSDCVGTSLRQGAMSVTQLEIMPRPPEERSPDTPWPMWPDKLRTSSSHKEGGKRMWSVTATEFLGADEKLVGVRCREVDCEFENGRPGNRHKFSCYCRVPPRHWNNGQAESQQEERYGPAPCTRPRFARAAPFETGPEKNHHRYCDHKEHEVGASE